MPRYGKCYAAAMNLAPQQRNLSSDSLRHLVSQLRGLRLLVLSGAGISTESGIPDYRGPTSAQRPAQPMRYQQFVAHEAMRRRYWARSFRGWLAVHQAQPNSGHRALARLERLGIVSAVLTQNVDGLHQAAGSQQVLELHGSLAKVCCLACGARTSRLELQQHMQQLNPSLDNEQQQLKPDGDASISEALIETFRVPVCERCGGMLKPDVVFFGENVPKARVAHAWQLLEQAQALLVVGSSLTVFSGYRFAVRAAEQGKTLAIINLGETRADHLADVKLEGKLGELLPQLAQQLAASL